VAVFGADHVYRMDPGQMIKQHVESGAAATVAAIPVPRADATEFGRHRGRQGRPHVEAFLEKPADPPARPGHPEQAYASMGNYVFTSDALVETLRKDAANEDSLHDMGGDIIPMLVGERSAQAYTSWTTRCLERPSGMPATGADVGTLDSYFDAHMDLCALHRSSPVQRPLADLTSVAPLPPAKFVHDTGDRVGRAISSLVSNGVIVSGGLVRKSVLCPGVRVDSWATVERARHPETTPGSAGMPWSGTRFSTRTSSSRKASRSGWTRNTTGPAASWSPRAGSLSSARASWCRSDRRQPEGRLA